MSVPRKYKRAGSNAGHRLPTRDRLHVSLSPAPLLPNIRTPTLVKLPSLTVPSVLRRDGVQRALKAALALGAMGYLVYLVEPSEIAAAVAGARYDYLTAALLLLPLNVLLEGATWRRILTVVVPRASWRRVFGALLCGFSLGLVTPAQAGGYAGRAFYFERGDRWAIAATVFVQRLLDMLAAVSGGAAALAWALATGRLTGSLWQGFLVVGVSLGLALLLLFAMPRRTAGLLHRLIPSQTVRGHLDFLKRLGPARMMDAGLRAGGRFLVFTTQFVLFARAFSPEASFGVLYGGAGLVFFAKYLIPPVTIMDVGIREGAAVFFLSAQLGLPEATAFNAAFLLFLTNLALPAAVGAPLLLRLRLSREDEDDAERDDAADAATNGEVASIESTADREREAVGPRK